MDETKKLRNFSPIPSAILTRLMHKQCLEIFLYLSFCTLLHFNEEIQYKADSIVLYELKAQTILRYFPCNR